MKIQEALTAWKNSGRVAFYRPTKRTVSLNGFPDISEREAIQKIQDTLKHDEAEFQKLEGRLSAFPSIGSGGY